MRDDDCPEHDEAEPTALDTQLRALVPEPVPEDLLSRCLATIDTPGRSPGPWRTRRGPWASRLATAAVAVILIGGLVVVTRPGPATAASFLEAVRTSWTEIPACHRVVMLKGPAFRRTIETWFVRGKGGHQETRSGDSLVGIVVNNGRWEFRWDLAEHLVAAWSTTLIGKRSEFERAGLVQDSEALLRWAESHQADIHVEADNLDGRKVRKVVLRWPGAGGPGAPTQVDTVWFDPDSLRPVKQTSELWDGGLTEARYDYPELDNVPADLLTFRPPRDVTLEINDPDLGRQVYSEAQAKPTDRAAQPSKGAEQ